MTEDEWLASTDSRQMVRYLEQHAEGREDVLTARKSRLFTISCCGLASERLKLRGLDLFKLAWQCADGIANEEELRNSRRLLAQLVNPLRQSLLPLFEIALSDSVPAREIVGLCYRSVWANTAIERPKLAPLLREIFGNPFRPIALPPAWLTTDVLALARGIYEEKAFDRMPILADALQDAACDSEDLLTHCRDETRVHVRGCWVVDLLLGQE